MTNTLQRRSLSCKKFNLKRHSHFLLMLKYYYRHYMCAVHKFWIYSYNFIMNLNSIAKYAMESIVLVLCVTYIVHRIVHPSLHITNMYTKQVTKSFCFLLFLLLKLHYRKIIKNRITKQKMYELFIFEGQIKQVTSNAILFIFEL